MKMKLSNKFKWNWILIMWKIMGIKKFTLCYDYGQNTDYNTNETHIYLLKMRN